jgi:hypothetical protein
MILAELEVFHSRPYSPTRRVALGHRHLPVDPAPGFGGVLLGGIVAAHMGDLDPDLYGDLTRLTIQLEDGRRVPQPRLRHRFQTDHIGLAHSRHRLVGDGELMAFDFETHGSAAQQILAAVYAAGQLPPNVRGRVMAGIRRGMSWPGPVGPALIAHLSGRSGAGSWSPAAFHDPVQWALAVLGMETGGEDTDGEERPVTDRREVQRRFRDQLRRAHPDHGADAEGAAQRITDLTEARRILLG